MNPEGRSPEPATRAEPRRPAHSQPGALWIALRLAYDGSSFMGWQLQPHGASVQGRLEDLLAQLTGQRVRVHGSGRTDAGVHARNQVAAFHLPAPLRDAPPLELERLRRGLNALGAPHLVVKQMLFAAADFHPRFSACGKVYVYRLHNHSTPPLFARPYTWWVRQALDRQAMCRAAATLLGRHDFSAFRAAGCLARDPRRTLHGLRLRSGGEEGELLCLELEGDGFLRHMVRILCGTLVEVGLGRRDAASLPALLRQGDRRLAGPTAPAQGLFLERVRYDPLRYPQLRPLWEDPGYG